VANLRGYKLTCTCADKIPKEKIALLEGADDCIVTSSGQAAMFSAILGTCRAGDEIVVLDRGRVAERGTHAELVSSGGLYQRMRHAAQAGADPPGP